MGSAGFGGAAAAPVFRAVSTEAMRVLDVPKDLPDEAQPKLLMAKAETDAPPEDTGSGEPNILEDGDGDGAAQPASGPKTPNFRGMTVRAVLTEAQSMGLIVLPKGSGVARGAEPARGLAA